MYFSTFEHLDSVKRERLRQWGYTETYVQIHSGQPGNFQGYSWLPLTLPVFPLYLCCFTKFSSLNSLLTAEAIGYVNVDKANFMTGKEIKISVHRWSWSALDPSEMVFICLVRTGFPYVAFILPLKSHVCLWTHQNNCKQRILLKVTF